MGMSYRIDRERRVVLTRAWGVLSTREMVDVTSRILLAPRFDPTYRSLGDLREVTDIAVDALAERNGQEVRIFDAVPDAEAWLEL